MWVFAGGLEEDGPVLSTDATSGTVMIPDGPLVETKEFLSGKAKKARDYGVPLVNEQALLSYLRTM